MKASLRNRCTGRPEPLPDRFAGLAAVVLIAIALVTAPAWAAKPTPYDTINRVAVTGPVTVHRVRGGVVMLDGSGGNIGVLTAPDGMLMVDTGIAVSEAKIKAALATLGGQPLRTVILTHWHWDHSDGDGWVRRTGATLLADPEAIKRLTQTNTIVEWGHTFTPVAPSALPNEPVPGEKTLRFGDETRPHRSLPRRPYRRRPVGLFSEGRRAADRRYLLERRLPVHRLCHRRQHRRRHPRGEREPAPGQALDRSSSPATARSAIIAALVAFRDMLVEVRGKVAALKAQRQDPGGGRRRPPDRRARRQVGPLGHRRRSCSPRSSTAASDRASHEGEAPMIRYAHCITLAVGALLLASAASPVHGTSPSTGRDGPRTRPALPHAPPSTASGSLMSRRDRRTAPSCCSCRVFRPHRTSFGT